MELTKQELIYLIDAMELIQKREDCTGAQLLAMTGAERANRNERLDVSLSIIKKMGEEFKVIIAAEYAEMLKGKPDMGASVEA